MQYKVRKDFSNPPSRQEIWEAVGKMKIGKAGGEISILREMMKEIFSDDEIMDMIVTVTHHMWEECKVPADWCNAVLIPVPKKGNLKKCDNWRGTALLGKVVV